MYVSQSRKFGGFRRKMAEGWKNLKESTAFLSIFSIRIEASVHELLSEL